MRQQGGAGGLPGRNAMPMLMPRSAPGGGGRRAGAAMQLTQVRCAITAVRKRIGAEIEQGVRASAGEQPTPAANSRQSMDHHHRCSRRRPRGARRRGTATSKGGVSKWAAARRTAGKEHGAAERHQLREWPTSTARACHHSSRKPAPGAPRGDCPRRPGRLANRRSRSGRGP